MSQTVSIPGVGDVDFPDGMSDADIGTAAKKLYQQAQSGQKPSDSTSMAGAGAMGILPTATKLAESLATSPGVPEAGSDVGQLVGLIGGLLKAGPLGTLATNPMGRVGYRAGTLAQKAAAPIATALDSAKPYANGILGTMTGAMGVGDLAQMADPTRKDIGVMGVGPTVHVEGEKPALLNAAADKIKALLQQVLGQSK